MANLASVVDYASLDADLFLLLHQKPARETIRRTIIETYFPDKAELFRAAIAENQEINVIENLLLENAGKESFDETKMIPATPKRSAAFPPCDFSESTITPAPPALCEFSPWTAKRAVQAAHIFPFARSFDDSIGNGLTLCPLHHWSVRPRFVFNRRRLQNNRLRQFSGKRKRSVADSQLKIKRKFICRKKNRFARPLTMIRWHRENTFV